MEMRILLSLEVRPPDWPLSLTGLSPSYNLQTLLELASSPSRRKTVAGIERCNNGYLLNTKSYSLGVFSVLALFLTGRRVTTQ